MVCSALRICIGIEISVACSYVLLHLFKSVFVHVGSVGQNDKLNIYKVYVQVHK